MRLRARKVHDSVRIKIVERIKKERKAIDKAKRAKARVHREWDKVLDPLKKEIEAVRVRVSQLGEGKRTKDYHADYLSMWTEYLHTLRAVRDLLSFNRRVSNDTPTQAILAAGRTQGQIDPQLGEDSLPYGMSWVDWIGALIVRGTLPRNIIETLTAQHAALPYTRRPPEPLFRRDDYQRKLAQKQHDNILSRWQQELNQALDRQHLLPDDHPEQVGVHKTITLIRLAMDRLRKTPLSKRVPTRWTQLIKTEDHDTLFGKDCGISGADLPPSVLDEYEWVED